MPINDQKKQHEDGFSDIEVILLNILLLVFGFAGLGYYFVNNNRFFQEPIYAVEQKKERKERKRNKRKKNKKVRINRNRYVPVVDCLWLNILSFLIVTLVSYVLLNTLRKKNKNSIQDKISNNEELDELDQIIFFISKHKILYSFSLMLFHQIFFYIIWFFLILIFATFSKIWDKEHSWWSNVKKGFLDNKLYKGRLSLIPILSPVVFLSIFIYLT